MFFSRYGKFAEISVLIISTYDARVTDSLGLTITTPPAKINETREKENSFIFRLRIGHLSAY